MASFFFDGRKEKNNITLSIEVKGAGLLSNTSSSREEGAEMDDVKIKEIVIVSLILTIWFYSLYRSSSVLPWIESNPNLIFIRFFKVWRDILNFSAETLHRTNGYAGGKRSLIKKFCSEFAINRKMMIVKSPRLRKFFNLRKGFVWEFLFNFGSASELQDLYNKQALLA